MYTLNYHCQCCGQFPLCASRILPNNNIGVFCKVRNCQHMRHSIVQFVQCGSTQHGHILNQLEGSHKIKESIDLRTISKPFLYLEKMSTKLKSEIYVGCTFIPLESPARCLGHRRNTFRLLSTGRRLTF